MKPTRNPIVLAVHGGAGTIARNQLSSTLEKEYRYGLSQAVEKGYAILRSGGTALDAVEKAVQVLEDFPLFNAGKGSVFTHAGTQEMDASIMCGRSLGAGAVGGVHTVQNPIRLARKVLEHSEHIFLYGPGAETFGRLHGVDFQPEAYFFTEKRYAQLVEARAADVVRLDHSSPVGTVGAVALDRLGDLAAATSTGGMTNKKFNRIGDSPIIGAGTYADNRTCAVSCTGHGEYFILTSAAFSVAAQMLWGNKSLIDAAHFTVYHTLKNLGGEGGLIALDTNGNLVLPYNSDGMYRAWCVEGKPICTAIYES